MVEHYVQKVVIQILVSNIDIYTDILDNTLLYLSTGILCYM
jgi:hypothetical protein